MRQIDRVEFYSQLKKPNHRKSVYAKGWVSFPLAQAFHHFSLLAIMCACIFLSNTQHNHHPFLYQHCLDSISYAAPPPFSLSIIPLLTCIIWESVSPSHCSFQQSICPSPQILGLSKRGVSQTEIIWFRRNMNSHKGGCNMKFNAL